MHLDTLKNDPLFAWPKDSTRMGDGLRYQDVASLLKEAAIKVGVDPKTIGTHSVRRGSACAYLQSGCAYHSVKIYGRWSSDCVREYVDVWDNMMCGAASRVARGFSDPNIRPTTALPPREQQLHDAAHQWSRFTNDTSHLMMPDASLLLSPGS